MVAVYKHRYMSIAKAVFRAMIVILTLIREYGANIGRSIDKEEVRAIAL